MRRSEARANLRRVIARTIEYMASRGPGRPTTEEAAVRQYQRDLEDAYDAWADDAAKKLAAEQDAEKRNALLLVLLLLLLSRLTDIANTELPNAIALGLDGTPGDPATYAKVAEVMAENADYLKNSLIPDIQIGLQNVLNDPGLQAAIKAYNYDAAAAALRSAAGLLKYRITAYSGSWWALLNYAIGTQAENLGKRIRWTRDPQAKHCATCMQFGERTYDSFAAMMEITGGISPADGTNCRNNCRCIIEVVD